MSIKYSDSGFLDGADSTKKLSFDVSGVTTGTTRTITMPDANVDLSSVGTPDDNSVTLAKMAHGTDGELITYDAAGAPANVAVGTSGQVLTSGGTGVAPTFQTAAAGGVDGIVSSANATAITIDSSENVGVKTSSTLKTWYSQYSAIQLGHVGAWYCGKDGTGFGNTISENVWSDGSPKYLNSSYQACEYSMVDGAHKFRVAPSGTADAAISWTTAMTIGNSGNVVISGSLSKGSGSFRIPHPLTSKKDTHELVHSFVESPRTDLIYRGKTQLTNGQATVNIDTYFGMTEGIFDALTDDVDTFTSNESGWDSVKGSVIGNILTIDCQSDTCSDTISWMVVADRKDEHIMNTEWTDENGKPILEPEIVLDSDKNND